MLYSDHQTFKRKKKKKNGAYPNNQDASFCFPDIDVFLLCCGQTKCGGDRQPLRCNEKVL